MAQSFFMGDIKMKPKNLVQGVGINDADYAVAKHEMIRSADGKQKKKQTWMCPYYRSWVNMLRRCYSTKLQEEYPTYTGCTVSNDWLKFTNFKNWMEQQSWEGKQLDKDILFEGNKVYSTETCVFVSPTVNSFANDQKAVRGEWPIGVHWNKRKDKFHSRCSNPFSGKRETLGYFDCELEAHEAWIKRKLELAHELASIQEDPRVAKALIDRYSIEGK